MSYSIKEDAYERFQQFAENTGLRISHYNFHSQMLVADFLRIFFQIMIYKKFSSSCCEKNWVDDFENKHPKFNLQRALGDKAIFFYILSSDLKGYNLFLGISHISLKRFNFIFQNIFLYLSTDIPLPRRIFWLLVFVFGISYSSSESNTKLKWYLNQKYSKNYGEIASLYVDLIKLCDHEKYLKLLYLSFHHKTGRRWNGKISKGWYPVKKVIFSFFLHFFR